MDNERIENLIVIERFEYDELLIKAFKFGLLKEEAKKSNYLSEVEQALFELKGGEEDA